MSLPEEHATVGGWIRQLAEREGDRILLVGESGRLTYHEADAASGRIARGLLAAGLGKGSRVGVLLPNGPEWVLAWLAAARIGALVVPLNTFYQARELGWVLRHSDVDTLLTTAHFLSHDYLERLERFAPELAGAAEPPLRIGALPFLRHVRIWSSDGSERPWASGGRAALETLAAGVDETLLAEVEREVRPADPMVVIYSSGSTADPKGAIHTHGSAIRHAWQLNQQRDLQRDDRIYSPMPFFWVGGFVFTLLSTMHLGARLYVQDAFDAGHTLDLIEGERITIVAGWPHYGKAMAEHPSFASRDLSSIRTGNLYDLLPEEARPADPELRSNSLGMTETCGPHTFGAMHEDLPEKLRGSFGQSVPGLEHKIVSPESGEALTGDALGEICVRGTSVMQGLYKQEREEVFDADGYYHTGDGGSFSPDGHLFFKGRLGDLIKTAGANVTPREVEIVLEALPGVARAHVVGVPHPDRGENVAAAVVLAPGAEADAAALRQALRQELSAYKVPRHFLFLAGAEIPMTDTGKLDARRLKALLAERVAAGADA